MERSPEDVAAGVLRLSIGGSVREVPTLKIRWIPEWAALLHDDGGGKEIGEWTMEDSARFAGETVGRMLDLVVAYDRTGALGGRAWLEEHADPAEAHAALVAMAGNAFPLASAATLVDLALVKWAAASIPPSSTSSRSPSGTSRRERRASSSTRSR